MVNHPNRNKAARRLRDAAPDLLSALRTAHEALTNVPMVGGVYDQQHSDTHLRAWLEAGAAIATATEETQS